MTLTAAQLQTPGWPVPGTLRPIAEYCLAQRLHDGAAGIAHLRPDGTAAFYPCWSAQGLNYVCAAGELTYGPYCDAEGRVLPY